MAKTFRALAHPARIEILNMLDRQEPLSPKNMGDIGFPGTTLGTISHHVRILAKAKAIEAAGKKSVRGAVQHFYRLAPRGRELLEAISRFNGR